MRKKALPKREQEICLRLKELRERLGLSEQAASERAGISRNRWHNYEMLRAPLRCDVALRICRQLIISEEWLATGAFKFAEEKARSLRIGIDEKLRRFYFRNLVDLQAEPEFLQVLPGELFSDAFERVLARRYRALIQVFFHVPRLVFRDDDSDELLNSYLLMMNERWLELLRNEAMRLSRSPGLVRRTFLRGQIDFSMVFFKRMMGWDTPEIESTTYDFLRVLAGHTSVAVGPLHMPEAEDPKSSTSRPAGKYHAKLMR